MAINTFDMLGEELREALKTLGLDKPTEPQAKAIPEILAGKNVLVVAPTGTGKTEAAVLPVFDMILRIKRDRKAEGMQGILCIYVTPLRALNRDLLGRLLKIAEKVGISVEVRHGDTSQCARRRQAQQPPDVLITTPETLQAILVGRVLRKRLSSTRWVIIDEIHELVDNKRGVQLALALERLKRITRSKLQRIGLSATVGSVNLVRDFLAGSDGEVQVVHPSTLRKMLVVVDAAPIPSGGHDELNRKLQVTPQLTSSILKMNENLRKHASVLVFTNTRESAELLASRLSMVADGFTVKTHHGSLSKEERIKAEEEFKSGIIKALVCTSSLELGLDIGSVDYVIQFLSPRQATPLLQRVGRSSHRVGGVARGLIISCSSDDILESAVLAKRAMSGMLEEIKVHECALDVLAHQVVGLVMDEQSVDLEEAFNVVRRAYPYRNLSFEDFKEVIEFLRDRGVIRLKDSKIKWAGRATRDFYFQNLSMIPDVKKFDVITLPEKRKVGTLDEEFVVTRAESTSSIILGGRVWKIIGVDESKVYVEPSDDVFGAIPAWVGELIPVHTDVAREVAALRRKVEELYVLNPTRDGLMNAFEGYPLTREAAEVALNEILDHLKMGFPLPTDKRVVVESLGNYVVVHACFGTKVNELLGLLISRVLGSSLALPINYRSDQYRIILMAPRSLRTSLVAKVLSDLTPDDVEQLAQTLIPSSEAYLWSLFNVAKRMGVVDKEADPKAFSKAHRFLMGTLADRAARMEVLIEKFDVESLKKVLEMLKEHLIEIIWFEAKAQPSPLAMPMLNKYLLPVEASSVGFQGKTLEEAIMERLMERTVKLACMYCSSWSTTRKVKYLPEDLKCPSCGARYIAVTWPSDDKIGKLLKKRLHGKLTRQEEEEVKRYQLSAGLVLTYGKKAVIALAARGVGPQTASRILAKDARGDGSFYLELLEAEKTYIRTRMYWDAK